MKDYHNQAAPMLSANPTFRGDVAMEMDEWCAANCMGKWEIVTPDHVRFEFPTDAVQFGLYYWSTKSIV